jgi:hypothetical protein
MTAAAAGFGNGSLNVVQCLLSKAGANGESGVPLTRDDIYRSAVISNPPA